MLSPIWSAVTSSGGTLRVLAYHEVLDEDRLRSQLSHALAHYTFVDLDGVERFLSGSRDVVRPCWVTFDDGHPTVVESALPILQDLDIPATMFVCPSVIDTTSPFWWQIVAEAARQRVSHSGKQVSRALIGLLKKVPDTERRAIVGELERALEAKFGVPMRSPQLTRQQIDAWVNSGREVGNHTWDHPVLSNCSEREQSRQIERAHEWLTDRLGHCVAFAYPNGDQTRHTEIRLTDLGYRVGVLFDHRLARERHRLGVSRIRVNAHDSLQEFQAKLSGLHPFIHHAVGRS